MPFTYNVNANQQPSYQSQNTIVPQNNQIQQNSSGNRGGNGGQTNNQSTPAYTPDTRNPVYGIYGSSVISVNPDPSPFKLQLNSAQPTFNPTQQFESRSNTPDFDPKALGLPVGNNLFPQPLPGLYSSSGFDMLGVLARVVARPNPQINIGPVDTSCSFLVVDARRYDMPIVFASTTFSDLTGYSNVSTLYKTVFDDSADAKSHSPKLSDVIVDSCKLRTVTSPWAVGASTPMEMQSTI